MENEFLPKHRDEESQEIGPSEVEIEEKVTSVPIASPETEEAPTNMTRTADIIATALSWILVPLNMPLFGLWFLFGLSILIFLPTAVKWQLTGIFFGLDILLPMLMVILLKRLGLVDDLGLNGRKERSIPYLLSIAVLAGSGYWCQRLGIPLWIAGFYYGGAVAGVINLIVNFWWKISAHMAAMAGVLALLARLWVQGEGYGPCETWLIIWIILTGILGTARIWLGRHTPMQVFCGGAVGFISVWFMTTL